MAYVIKNTAGAVGSAGSARLNSAGELVSIPWAYQMALEGRVWLAGHGIEEAGIDGEASLDDTTPSFAIVAPTSGAVVIPLFFRSYFDTEGGAAPDWHFAYVKADKGVYGTGTAVTAINALGGSSTTTPQAQCRSSLSGVTAITNAQNVVLTERIQVLDNFVSVEGATTNAGVEAPGGRNSTMEALWVAKDYAPITLYKGSALLFYAATGTTDTKYNYSAGFIELDPTIWVPNA